MDPRGEGVRKGTHCAWQIHYLIVFPVKYLNTLLDEVVTTMIQGTAAEIAKRFPIEREAMGTDKIIPIRSAVRIGKWRQAALCRYLGASRHGRSFVESLQ